MTYESSLSFQYDVAIFQNHQRLVPYFPMFVPSNIEKKFIRDRIKVRGPVENVLELGKQL
jgi:hypothetical protein